VDSVVVVVPVVVPVEVVVALVGRILEETERLLV
jgi:hypothetical protein